MWAQVINAAIGIWLMAAPAVLGYDGAAMTNDRIVGPIVATFAIISWWAATRGTARWNVPLGLWLVAAPWVLGYDATAAVVNATVCGLLVAGLALVPRHVEQHFGGGWAALFKADPPHERAARRT